MHQARHRTGASRWSIRPRSLAALAVAAAGLAASIWLPGRDDAASAAVARPAFADDFSGAPGSQLDQGRWSVDGGTDNGAQDGNGNAVLTRLLRTRQAFDQKYGHAEARVEANRPGGVWRAFSVLDRYGRLIPGRLQSLRGGIDPTGGGTFHTYAIDWSPQAIVWSVDGHPTLRLTPKRPADGIVPVLNLTLGGFGPVRMTVDFVHVAVYGWPGGHPAPSRGTSSPASPSGSPSGPATSPATAGPADPTASPSGPVTSPSEPSSGPSDPSPGTSATPSDPAPSTTPTTAPTKAPAASPWQTYTDYRAGDLVTYRGVTYKVLEAHTSLPGWEPPNLPSLFQKV